MAITQLLGWFTWRIVGHLLEETDWKPYVLEGVRQPLTPPPFLLGSGGTSPAMIGFFCLDEL
jgi:hypothetical protein